MYMYVEVTNSVVVVFIKFDGFSDGQYISHLCGPRFYYRDPYSQPLG
jgi:hypothetical protein